MCQIYEQFPHGFVEDDGVDFLHEFTDNLPFIILDNEDLVGQLLNEQDATIQGHEPLLA
jgi:hypothetical protein